MPLACTLAGRRLHPAASLSESRWVVHGRIDKPMTKVIQKHRTDKPHACKKAIGFVIVSSGIGGMETYLLRLLSRLPVDTRAVVFVRADVPGVLHSELAATGAVLIYGGLGYARPLRLVRLYRQLEAENLDALVDLTGVFAGITLWVARLAGIPRRIVFHRRSTYAFQQTRVRMAFTRFSIGLVERFATAILANSQSALDRFHARLVGRDPRLGVIANLIDGADMEPRCPRAVVRTQLALPDDAVLLLHVGRVDPAKDHGTLLRAMVSAMTADPRLFAMLVGPGTDRLPASLEGLIPPDLHDRFRLLGNRTDIADLNHAADVFVFPSVTEGQPNALLEAMLCGLPVVASNIAPIREVVPPRAHALLVAPGDVAGFAAAIHACVNDPAEADARRYRAEAQRITAPDTILPRLFSLILPDH